MQCAIRQQESLKCPLGCVQHSKGVSVSVGHEDEAVMEHVER